MDDSDKEEKYRRVRYIEKFPNFMSDLRGVEFLHVFRYDKSTVPKDVFDDLTDLIKLSIVHSKIVEIPNAVEQLINLQVLNVSFNSLESVPETFSELKLKKLNLSGNAIEKVPAPVMKITSLKVLKMNKCQLKEFPEDLQSWKNLEKLLVDDNSISELPNDLFEKATSLRHFSADDNLITVLSDSIENLTLLETLSISRNRLTSIPHTIGKLQRLTSLDIATNQLSELPIAISDLVNLTDFDARSNAIKTISFYVDRLKSLQTLNLACNKLEEFPKSKFPKDLATVTLSFNKITKLPDDLSSLSNVKTLLFCYNSIKIIPSALFKMKNFEVIDAASNHAEITDVHDEEHSCCFEDSETEGKCHGMKTLTLDQNNINMIPNFLNEMKQLKELSMRKCNLKDLPENMCNLTELKTLRLDDNKLTRIPENAFSNMKSLKSLYIVFNKISKLPSFRGLKKLKNFMAYGNAIRSFPEDLQALSDLEKVDLSANFLEELPKDIINLPKLHYLRLYNNRIEDIPVDIGTMKFLRTLDLGLNKLKEFPEVKDTSVLVSINLCENKLTSIHESLYSLPCLQFCNISNNEIASFDERLFQMKELTNLDISNNVGSISSPTDDDSTEILKMTELKMSHNKMESLPVCLPQMRRLIILECYSCSIARVPEKLNQLKELRTLVMSENNISSLHGDVFKSLVHLVKLDVSSNNLTAIPSSIGDLVNLETLDFARNEIKEVPKTIGQLKCIQKIALQFNKIELLPCEFTNLKQLRSLNLSHNLLEEVRFNFESLKKMNLNHNKLKKMPDVSCSKIIGTLDVSHNDIETLPSYVFVDLPKLRLLNISNNKIEKVAFKLVDAKLDLLFDHNPIRWPPPNIQILGLQAIRTFFKDLQDRESTIKPEIKLQIIGRSSAGKTTLCLNLPRENTGVGKIKTTKVVESSKFELCCDDKSLSVSAFDMAGQEIYDSTHRIFFSDESLYILAINAKDYNDDQFEEFVSRWLDMLLCYTKKPFLIVLFTHVDLCKNKTALNTKLKTIRKRIDDFISMRKKSNPRIVPPEIIGNDYGDGIMINCTDQTHQGYERIRHVITKTCFDANKMTLYTKVPYSWLQFEELLLTDKSLAYVEESTVKNYAELSGISKEDIVLKYLILCGKILNFNTGNLKGIVFHRPTFIISALQSIFMHDINNVCNSQRSNYAFRSFSRVKSDQKSENRVFAKLRDKARSENMTEPQIKDIFNYMKNGIFPMMFVEILFRHYVGEGVNVQIMIDLMKKFKFCYKVKPSNAAEAFNYSWIPNFCRLCFPCYFLKKVSDMDIYDTYPRNNKNSNKQQEVEFKFTMSPYCGDVWPQLIVTLHEHASSFLLAWGQGLIVVIDKIYFFIKLSKTEEFQNMLITIFALVDDPYNDSSLARSFWTIHHILNEIRSSIKGLNLTVELVCPDCKGGEFVVKQPTVESARCKNCCNDISIGKILNVMESAIWKFTRAYSILDVALHLEKDPSVQYRWEDLAEALNMRGSVQDIKTEANNRPSRCVNLLIKQWAKNHQHEDYVGILLRAFSKFHDLVNATDNLKDWLSLK